jgi:predicted nucleic acid-binding protein
VTDLVIDASVAIKWVIDEPGSQEALALRRHRLFAPDLLVADCASVLWKKARRNELSAEEARLAACLLQRADVELAPTRHLLEPATVLAMALDHPAYDCIYLALAESLSCDLVTADQKFSAKTRPAGHKSRVLLLTGGALS